MIAIQLLVVNQNMFDDEVSVEAHAKGGTKAEGNRFQEKLQLPY